jgi:hypothetical protein
MHPSAKQSPYLSRVDTQHAMTTTRQTYAWGGSLTKSALKNAGADAAMQRKYAGMVKMDTSTPGGGKSSAFLTFRVMMEGSTGWVIPAKSGLYLAKKVADDMRPKAQNAFAQAIRQQLAKG